MPNWKALKDSVVAGLAKPGIGRGVAGGITGATGGALLGRYGTPKAFGYSDNPSAVNMSTLLDSVLFGALGAYGGSGALRGLGAKTGLGLAASLPAAELAPVGMDLLTKGRQSVTEGSQSLKDLAHAAKGIPISKQITSALGSNTGKGALAGAALAGLGAMGTGLTRAKSDRERATGRGRAGMVGMDFLKYVVPAMLAGGTAGHFKTPGRSSDLPS